MNPADIISHDKKDGSNFKRKYELGYGTTKHEDNSKQIKDFEDRLD
jgi:hypothetical protein